jgi:hypothetical protein
MMTFLPSCPDIGQNSIGVATVREGVTRPVRITAITPVNQFLSVIDLENGDEYYIHRNAFIMSKNTIPSKYREHHFQRVAHIWAAALDAYPNPVNVGTDGMSYEGFIRLLRETRDSKRLYGWKNPLIDEAKWASYGDSLKISLTPQGVFIAGPGNHAAIGKVVEASNAPVTTLQWKDFQDVENICSLLHHKVFKPAPRVKLSGLTDIQRSSLEQRYDLAFVPADEPETFFIV